MRYLTALLAIFLISGCTSYSNLEIGEGFDEENESIFFLGIAPSNFKVFLPNGSVKDGEFWRSELASGLGVLAEDGYIVSKAKHDDTIAITGVNQIDGNSSWLGDTYSACNGERSLVFSVPKGKVIYISDVTFKVNQSSLSIQYEDNIERARKYLMKKHPELAEKLEEWDFEFMPIRKSCPQNTVPIYI
ncbi:hypothetical protein [Enterovibrio norvegicus]|uniref:hypothetical protein n=1 Tax=Enterovibrio norvegicus TaxID=188144 RepID=UPI00352CD50B